MTTKTPLVKPICAAAFMALCLFAQPAWSITITQDDIPNQGTFVDKTEPDGRFTVEASQGREFSNNSFNNFDGFFGLRRGYVKGEIDISADEGVVEGILISFPDASQMITEITLGRLFAAGYWDDAENEVARIVATGQGPDQVGLLTVVDPTLAQWQVGAGPVTLVSAVSLGDASGAGVWTILDPFGDFQVDSLMFLAERLGGISPENNGQNSDYALHTIVTTMAPEPLTASLFGLGLAGLGVLGRRQRD